MNRLLLVVGGPMEMDLYLGAESLSGLLRRDDPLDKQLVDVDWKEMESQIMHAVYAKEPADHSLHRLGAERKKPKLKLLT